MKIPAFLQPRHPQLVLAAGVFALVLLLALHWQPGRQVRLHQAHLLRAIEDRNWKKTSSFIAADYHDRWHQNKEIALARLPQIFGTFLSCGVMEEGGTQTWEDSACIMKSHIRIVGVGGPVAQFVMEETGHLTEPFAFTWKHQGWKPWAWVLVEIDQPQVEIPASIDLY